MRETSIGVRIPSTFFYDGLFSVTPERAFDWELQVEDWHSSPGPPRRELVPVMEGRAAATIPVTRLAARAPHAFAATRGINFRIVVTDASLLSGAWTDPHGKVPYNEFNFPTVQFYCPRVEVGPIKRAFRSLWSTRATVRLYYP